MYKCLWSVLLGSVFMVACAKKDADYYWHHPAVLKQDLEHCQDADKNSTMSCRDLSALYTQVLALAGELQSSPQQFGQTIIALQEKLAHAPAGARKSIEQELYQRLAITRWLESPEGNAHENIAE